MLGGVVLVIDTPRFEEIAATVFPAAGRLRDVTAVVLNKTDLDTEGRADSLDERFRSANRSLRIHRTVRCDVPAETILAVSPGIKQAAAGDVASGPEDSTAGFSSVACHVDAEVDEGSLRTLLSRYPSIQRAKGFLRFAGKSGPREFQWVPGQFEVFPPQPEMARSRKGSMVLIGRRVPWTRFFSSLERCLARKKRRARERRP